ncbi:MAG: PrsW family intramembrane metalloprotease [Clostridia bacterium]|nr:PrsW family intramembrane metalloprotease [Clostridia bacterium]
MVKSESNPKRANNVIANFFKQTFRRHSGEEYSELLTRGMRGDGGVNKKYPWAYIRLFALMFVLYAVFLLIVRFTSNELFIPTITVLASCCINLSFLLFLYELYPKKDLSFMSVCLAMLLGGAMANLISQILFSLFSSDNPWLRAVYTGFFEELPKAVAVIAVIVTSRKNSPLAGFLMGAAVGCGFSIVEDMGYIFVQANEMPVMNLTTIIEVSVARGASAVCTHTLWTAAVGWAYCHFKRHLANIAFYLVSILSCGLHICWDLPLGNVALGFVYAGCVVVASVECVLILCFERKKVYSQNALPMEELYKNVAAVREMFEQVEQEDLAERSLSKNDPLYWKHWGRFTVALGMFLMAIIAICYCSLPFRETYETQVFTDPEAFVAFMQDGRQMNATENRPYNSRQENASETVEGGKVTRAVQCETVDSVTYNYEYALSHDAVSGNDYYFPVSVSATVTTDEGVNTYFKEDLYHDGKLYASFFRVNDAVTGFNFQRDGDVLVFVYNPAFVRDLSDWKYLSLFCVFAAILGSSAVCYISLFIKSWRVKKLCSTENASFAE